MERVFAVALVLMLLYGWAKANWAWYRVGGPLPLILMNVGLLWFLAVPLFIEKGTWAVLAWAGGLALESSLFFRLLDRYRDPDGVLRDWNWKRKAARTELGSQVEQPFQQRQDDLPGVDCGDASHGEHNPVAVAAASNDADELQ